MKHVIPVLFCLTFLASSAVFASDEVLIPAGAFLRGTDQGTDAERPVHTVQLDAFYIDKYEVSNEAFRRFNPSHISSPYSSCKKCPVTLVNWYEAEAYCAQAGKRLPTEAEWEKAARGPAQSDGIPPQTAHFAGPMQAGTVLVDTLEPNGYGLRHMHGNAWEWTSDWFDALYYAKSPRMNPTGPDDGYRKIVRGGSWYNPPYYAHAGMRFRLKPDVRLFSLGLRCARTP